MYVYIIITSRALVYAKPSEELSDWRSCYPREAVPYSPNIVIYRCVYSSIKFVVPFSCQNTVPRTFDLRNLPVISQLLPIKYNDISI